MTVKLPTEQHFEFLSLNGDCTCSSESTLRSDNTKNKITYNLLLETIKENKAMSTMLVNLPEYISFLK